MNTASGDWLWIVLAAVAVGLVGFKMLHARFRRRRLRAAPLPAQCSGPLDRVLARYPRLPQVLRAELRGRVNEFIHDKQFIGCNGLQMNDAIRATIAANACLLVLNRNVTSFPNVQTILVYPGAFVARYQEYEDWLQHDVEEVRAGESWERGPLVLAWDEIEADAATADHRNVIIHEFAHKLDEQNPDGEGLPPIASVRARAAWTTLMQMEFEALQTAAARGESTLIDPYGGETPAEFFAVLTETFFTQPVALRTRHPRLYGALRDCFHVDTATWTAPT